MRTAARTTGVALGAALSLLAAAVPAGAALAPGDIVVADPGAGALIKIDPASGQQALVSDNTISTADLFDRPSGVALESSGNLLVADADGPSPSSEGALIRVDPNTGQQTLVSDNTISGPDLFEDPTGIVVNGAGDVYVADPSADGGTGAVIHVDASSGQQTAVSRNTLSTLDLFEEPVGIAREGNGNLVVADLDSPPGGPDSGAIVGVNSSTGQQSLISDNGLSTLDLFEDPAGVAVESSGNLLVANDGADPASTGVIRVIRSSGQQGALSVGGDFAMPAGIALDADRQALVTDAEAFLGDGALFRVNPSSGATTTVSSNAISPPGLFDSPVGVAVVPPNCLGNPATLVGTNKTDTLMGTAGADVIVSRGGNDIVQGKDGRDLICGGEGRNRLVGGKGGDQLFGGAGPDVILANEGADVADGETGADKIDGGSGRDRLTGNKGRDNLVGGKAADKLFGNAKRDRLRGGKGNDLLKGGFGADKLFGGSGRDRLRGGPGRDKQKQ